LTYLIEVGKIPFMNKSQHIFVFVGIILLMIIAITFESKLIWLFPAIGLIAECVYLLKDISFEGKPPLRFWILLGCIIVFVIIFLIASEEPSGGRYIRK